MTSFETTTTRLMQQELGACALIQDLLPLYMEHEVSMSSRDLISEHLARCERCAGFLAGARSMREQLHREGIQRSDVAAQDQATRQAIALGQRRLRWLVLGGMCTLFGFSLLVVLVLSVAGTRPAPTRSELDDGGVQPGEPQQWPTPEISGIYPPDAMPMAPIAPPVEAAPIDPAPEDQFDHANPAMPQPWPTPVAWPTPTPIPAP
jgi:Putative zinc-finger